MVVALIYSTGPAWLPNTPLLEQSRTALQALAGHRNLLARLQEAGKLIMGGPYTDGSGGMAIVEVKSASEAAEILAKDPAVESGIFKAELHQWIQEFARPVR